MFSHLAVTTAMTVPKSERPLKYETTRPISASVTNINNDQQQTKSQGQTQGRRRAMSAGHKLKQKTQSLTDLTDGHSRQQNDQEQPNPPPMKIKIRPPESVTKFTDDMHRMNAIETDFKKTTMELQKKLGISPEGLIY